MDLIRWTWPETTWSGIQCTDHLPLASRSRRLQTLATTIRANGLCQKWIAHTLSPRTGWMQNCSVHVGYHRQRSSNATWIHTIHLQFWTMLCEFIIYVMRMPFYLTLELIQIRYYRYHSISPSFPDDQKEPLTITKLEYKNRKRRHYWVCISDTADCGNWRPQPGTSCTLGGVWGTGCASSSTERLPYPVSLLADRSRRRDGLWTG